MDSKLSKEVTRELSQRLYQEVQAGTPAPEAITRTQQNIEGQRMLTTEQLRCVVTQAGRQAFRNEQSDIEDALLQGLGQENWDVRNYETMIGKLISADRFLEAWKLLKTCKKINLGVRFPSQKKFMICKKVAESHDGAQILEAMLQEDPTDDLVRAFILLGQASKMMTSDRSEEAKELVRQISLEDSSLNIRLGKEMINSGMIGEGAKFAATAKGETRGSFIEVGNKLFASGHPAEAAEVIEPLIKLGIVRNRNLTSVGFELDALNLLAKCAKQDPTVKIRFFQEIKRLRQTEELPAEYIERLLFTYRTGMTFDPKKYYKIAKRYGKNNFMRVTGQTKEKLHQMPTHNGQVASQDLPELDESGEGKQGFESLMERGEIEKAVKHLLNFKGKVPRDITRIYESRIYPALSAGNHPFDVWDSVIEADPSNREILLLGTRKLLIANKISEAMVLFSRWHNGILKNGRVFGQQLFETGKRGNTHPSTAAAMILEEGHPKVALEIIKPMLLNFIATNHQIPLHVVQVFAKCAAVDGEIRNVFLEQIRDYRKHGRINPEHIDPLLQIIFEEEQEEKRREEKVCEARKLTHPNGSEENEEQYVGHIARSKFFQDPHAMLRAEPMDKTASLVAGRSRISKKRDQ